MYLNTVLLLGMLFLHIVDDYYLQGFLASAKQKSWWEKNEPNKMYSKDYIIALLYLINCITMMFKYLLA